MQLFDAARASTMAIYVACVADDVVLVSVGNADIRMQSPLTFAAVMMACKSVWYVVVFVPAFQSLIVRFMMVRSGAKDCRKVSGSHAELVVSVHPGIVVVTFAHDHPQFRIETSFAAEL
jgi:hypothetical protein